MNVCAYVQLQRTLQPTGVGKHINNMVPRLARADGVSLRLLAARRDFEAMQAKGDAWPLHGLPADTFGPSRAVMERAWTLLNRPPVERWNRDADWVYNPTETYVPTRRAQQAVTIHGLYWFEPDLPWYNNRDYDRTRRHWRVKMRPILNRADLLLTVSEFSKARTVELLGADPDRIAVVGNGVEPIFYEAGASAPAEPRDEPPFLLVVGGLTWVKGADFVLAAAELMHQRRMDVRLRVAGRSEPEFERRARDLSNVELLGYTDATQLAPLMRRSLGLLYLSRYDTFGIPVAEAMAAGAPVVVSTFACLPEIVGDAGIAVDASDPDDVVGAVNRLLDDPHERAILIERGQERARKFHWDNCAARLISALQMAG